MGSGHKDRAKMLIEFDACVDTTVGTIMYCMENERACIRPEFPITTKAEQIEIMRSKDRDYIHKIFKEKYHSSIDYLFKELLEQYPDEIYSLSPTVPAINKIITAFTSKIAVTSGMDVLCELLVRNSKELAVLKTRFPKSIIIDGSGAAKLDYSKYARIIISNPSHMERFDNIKFTLIAVLAYPENFKVINGSTALDKDALLKLGYTNQYELIDPI